MNYKTDNFETELRQIYNKNVRKFTTTLLFILNILFITRVKPLFRRTKPFFKRFVEKCKKDFKNLFKRQKKGKMENDMLTKMPFIIISEICSFLNAREIANLSRANKILNEKANINYIWEKVFYDKYDKTLKEVLSADEYEQFSHTNFDTYKESCKYYYFSIMKKKGRKVSEMKYRTFSDVVEEETIKSIFNLPKL